MPGTNNYLQQLLVSNPLQEPVLRAVIEALQLPQGSRGLDAGCGIGLQALLLAEEVGPAGHVTGLDISPQFLARAQKIVNERGLSDRILFREGDIHQMPFEDDTFDWLWSASCAGYPASPPRSAGQPLPLVVELARVVKPGGRLALVVWSSEQLLPGYPLLEARLNATTAGIAPFTRGMRAEFHHLRALGWLRAAGLEESTAQAFVGSIHAPLDTEKRRAMTALLEMRWGPARPEVSTDDWAEYERLCRPESPDCLLDRPDFYAFYTYTLFHGRVAGGLADR